jgi:short-subunit dehydrogenase
MVVLITGGSSGLGKLITEKLCENKDNIVYFTYKNSIENAENITSNFSNSIKIKCDFNNRKELNSLLNKLNDFNLDVLINNYYDGLFLYKQSIKIDPEEYLDSFNKNIIPNIAIYQSVIKLFRKKKKGKIITVLSEAINSPPIGSSIYVCNKIYLKQIIKSWRNENSKFGIKFLHISPGIMKTNLTSKIDSRILNLMLKDGQTLEKNLNNAADSIIENIYNDGETFDNEILNVI